MSGGVVLGQRLGFSLLSLLLLLFGADLGDHSSDFGVLLLSLGTSDLSSGVLDGEWVVLVGWLRVGWGGSNLLVGVLQLGSVKWFLLLLGWTLDGWSLLNSGLLWLSASLVSSDLHWLLRKLSELWSWEAWILVLESEGLVLPVLGWVLVAFPEINGVLFSVLVVSELEALFGLVDDVLSVEPDLLVNLVVESSDGHSSSLLHSGHAGLDGVLDRQSLGSVGVLSDGSGSLIDDPDGSEVLDALGDLDDLVVADLLGADVQVSVSWHGAEDVEWRLPQFALWMSNGHIPESLPLLGWVLVAVPPGQHVVVLRLEVLWVQALLLGVDDVDDSLLGGGLDVDVLLIGGSSVLSEASNLSDVESVETILVGKSQVSVRVLSDGLGSIVIDEPRSPVDSVLVELGNSVLSVLLSADNESEWALGVSELEHESLGELWLWLLVLVDVFNEDVVSLGINGLSDSWSVVLSLELSWLDDDDLDLLGLDLVEWLPLDWGKRSPVGEGQVQLSSSELGVESSVELDDLRWLVLPESGSDVVTSQLHGEGEVSLVVESDGLSSGVPGELLLGILVVQDSGSDEWLVILLSDSSPDTNGVSWTVGSSEHDHVVVSGGGVEVLGVLDLLVAGLGLSHEGDLVDGVHLGVDSLASVPLVLRGWLEVHWLQAELAHLVLGDDLTSEGNQLGGLLLEWLEDGFGTELSWEVAEPVVERQGVLSVVVWSQGLGSLLPDELLSLVHHVEWLGDELELWHDLLQWVDSSNVGQRVLWLNSSSDDQHLLVKLVKVQVKSWGSWAGKSLDSLERFDLLVLEELDGPLLGWVLVALPPGEESLILVGKVSGGQALLDLVGDLVLVVDNPFLVNGSHELSEAHSLTHLESILLDLGEGVGDGKMFVGVKSDRLGSLVHDEEGSPVVHILGDLESHIWAILLLADVDLSVSWHARLNEEWDLPWLALELLLWDLEHSVPVLSWVLVALPPHQEVLILVLVVLGSQALLGLVDDGEDSLLSSFLDVNVVLINSSGVLSEGNGLSDVESVVSVSVGESKRSVGIESDGSGSSVLDEPGSPVVDSSLDLDNFVWAVLLGAHVDSSLSLHGELKVELLAPLWLLEWLGKLLLDLVGGSGDDLFNSWGSGSSHLLLDGDRHDVEVLEWSLSASLPGHWGVWRNSDASKAELSPLVDLGGDFSVDPSVLLGGFVLEPSDTGWRSVSSLLQLEGEGEVSLVEQSERL